MWTMCFIAACSVMSKCVTILTRAVGDLGRKRLVRVVFPFFLPLSLSLFSCMLKSHSLVKFSALFSGPDGRFLLVGCDSYITPLMTRTSSCFLQPRLKVNLSGGGALQHPVPLHPVRLGDAHTQSLSLPLSCTLSCTLSMSLTLSVTAEDRGRDRRARALFIFYIFPILFLSPAPLTLFQLFFLL